jgi:hypothetical protein
LGHRFLLLSSGVEEAAGSTELHQARTHNPVNEITGITAVTVNDGLCDDQRLYYLNNATWTNTRSASTYANVTSVSKESVMYSTIRLVVPFLVAVSWLPGYGDDRPYRVMRPCPGEFDRSYWSERWNEGRSDSFSFSRFQLGDGVVLRSGRWLVFTIGEILTIEDGRGASRRILRTVAVGALELDTGRMRQLTLPIADEQQEFRMVFSGDPLVPLGSHHCGIILRKTAPAAGVGVPAQNGDQVREADATCCAVWIWDLNANTVEFAGPLVEGVTRLVSAIGLDPIKAGWKPDAGDPMQGELRVTDPDSQKTACVRLVSAQRVSLYSSQTFATTGETHAFVVCDAWTDELTVFCVDPNALGGRRWSLNKGDLEAIVGPGIQGAAFVSNAYTVLKHKTLLLIFRIHDEVGSTEILVLDLADGTTGPQARLSDAHSSGLLPEIAALSADARRLAFPFYKDAATSDVRLAVVDVDSGVVRESANLRESIDGLLWVWGFADSTKVILADYSRVCIIDSGTGEWELHVLIDLAGGSDRDP